MFTIVIRLMESAVYSIGLAVLYGQHNDRLHGARVRCLNLWANKRLLGLLKQIFPCLRAVWGRIID